jgi:hypothetical protein
MEAPSKESFDFTPEQIQNALNTWANYNGFEGDTCHKCKLTANVLGGPGWICTCGHYILQNWHGGRMMPHDYPDLGPTKNIIHMGHHGWIANGIPKDLREMALKDTGLYIGPPMPTHFYTVHQLRKNGMQGIYRKAWISDYVTDYLMELEEKENFKKLDFRNFDIIIDKQALNSIKAKDSPLPEVTQMPICLTEIGRVDFSHMQAWEIPEDGRLEARSWANDDGSITVLVEPSASFKRKYGENAIPLYNDPNGLIATYAGSNVVRYRSRWNGQKYVTEKIDE